MGVGFEAAVAENGVRGGGPGYLKRWYGMDEVPLMEKGERFMVAEEWDDEHPRIDARISEDLGKAMSIKSGESNFF
jgi:hypothetical protein